MANKLFPTIPGRIDITDDRDDFRNQRQVVWTASDWTRLDGVTINYGPAAGTWYSNENFDLEQQGNMYQFQQDKGLILYAKADRERQTVFQMTGHSRWMPASVFNGIGFETFHQHESGSTNHDVYVAEYALVFRNRTSGSTRSYGVNTGYGMSPGDGKYRYDYIKSSDSHVNTIRSWGSDWLYQGLIMNFRTGGGYITISRSFINVYNVKVGHKFTANISDFRFLPLENRSEANRDGSRGNIGFSNAYEV